MPFYTGHIAAASNRADLIFRVELIDPATNDVVDLTGSTITVALRPTTQPSPAISGTNLDGHITISGPGQFDVVFSREEMTRFSPGDLDIGITVKFVDGRTYQLFAGQLPVVDGVVAA
jgi:hypothetical protein